MTTANFINPESFDDIKEALNESPNVAKTLIDLKEANLGSYDIIKHTLSLLFTLADIDNEYSESSLALLKDAVKKVMNLVIKTLNEDLITSERNDSPSPEHHHQDYHNIELKARVLSKWWCNYLWLLGEIYSAKKKFNRWGNNLDVWFPKEEFLVLMQTLEALEEHDHWKILLLQSICKKEKFLSKKFESKKFDEYYQVVWTYFSNYISTELKNETKKSKSSKETYKILEFRTEILENLLKLFNSPSSSSHDKKNLKESILYGRFDKGVYDLPHSIIIGDDGGFYALLNTIDDEEKTMILGGGIEKDYVNSWKNNRQRKEAETKKNKQKDEIGNISRKNETIRRKSEKRRMIPEESQIYLHKNSSKKNENENKNIYIERNISEESPINEHKNSSNKNKNVSKNNYLKKNTSEEGQIQIYQHKNSSKKNEDASKSTYLKKNISEDSRDSSRKNENFSKKTDKILISEGNQIDDSHLNSSKKNVSFSIKANIKNIFSQESKIDESLGNSSKRNENNVNSQKKGKKQKKDKKIIPEDDEHNYKIIIGKGGFGKIRLCIVLLTNRTSETMRVGQIVCIKKSGDKQAITFDEIITNAWSDFSVGDIGKLIFSPVVYDMKLIENASNIHKKHQKAYTIQQFKAVYNGHEAFSKGNKYHKKWDHQKSYLISIFDVISTLLNAGICMTDLKPENTLYDGDNNRGMLIDLAGVVRKSTRKDLESCKIKYVKFYSKKFMAPEFEEALEKNEDNIILNLCQCLSFSLGILVKKIVLKFLDTESYKSILKQLVKNLTKKDPDKRISVEEGLQILKEIPNENNENISAMDFLPFMQSLLEKTQNDLEKFGINQNIKYIEENFISLFGSQLDPEKFKSTELSDLEIDINHFISDSKVEEKVLILLGSSGSGKSTILQKKYLETLRNWKVNDPIPVYINLAAEDNLRDRWKWLNNQLEPENQLNFNVFSGLAPYKTILFVDSFDEAANKNNYVYLFFEELGSNKENKILICCRSEFIQSEQDLIKWFGRGVHKGNSFIKRYIAPLGNTQFNFEEYLEKYYEKKSFIISREEIDQILLKIKEINLRSLMNTSFMVHLTMEVLPELLNIGQIENVNTENITKRMIYEKYILKKIRNAPTETKQIFQKELGLITNKEIFDFFHISALCLARILHENRSSRVIFQNKKTKELATPFFERHQYDKGTPYLDNQLLTSVIRGLDLSIQIRGIVPHEKITLGFSHDTIKNYFLSIVIMEECDLAEDHEIETHNNILGHHLIVKDETLIKFLSELVKEQKKFKEFLLEIMKKSKKIIIDDINEEIFEKKVNASANAISILVAANFSFVGADLSYIKISGANLRDGAFSASDFSDADLTNVVLEGCKLDQAIFQRTDMTDVKLGVPNDINTESCVNSIAVSPDDCLILSGSLNNAVQLWDKSNGNLVQTFKGHSDWVNSVAFSQDGDLIISASDDHTIKLWKNTIGGDNGILIKTFQDTDCVKSIAFSPDGKYIVSGSEGYLIKLWETLSGKLNKTLEGHTDCVTSVDFSPDGSLILSGSWDKTIRLWQKSTGDLTKIIEGHTDSINCAKFSNDKDGTFILSCSVDKTIKLWEKSTGKLLRTYEGHRESVNCAVFSPDEILILSCSDDNTINLWEKSNGNLLKTFEEHISCVNSVTFSRDGSLIMSAGWDNVIKLWENSTSNILKTFEGHRDWVNSVAFSPDGNFLLSCSNDKSIKLWGKSTGNLLKTYQGHAKIVKSISFSPDGNFFVSSSDDKTVRLWNRVTGELLKTLIGHKNIVNFAVFSPDGTLILSASDDNTIKLWEKSTGNFLKDYSSHTDRVNSVAFSPEGDIFVSSSHDKTIKLWENIRSNLLTVKTFEGHTNFVNCVIFSKNGDLILSGSGDKTVKLWDKSPGNLLKTYESHQDCVNSVIFSQDESIIISGSDDNTIKIWQIEGDLLQTCVSHINGVKSLAYSPKDLTFLSGSKDSTIKLWDKIDNDLQKYFEGHTARVKCVAFSPDCSLVLSGSDDKMIKLWRLSNGNLVRNFTGHLECVNCLAFSPDGVLIASGSNDKTIKVWKKSTGNIKFNFEIFTDSVKSISFSPSGSSILCSSNDNSIKLFKIITGTIVQTFEKHINSVNCVSFSPGGEFIVSGSSDNMIFLWETATGELLKQYKGHENRVNSVIFSPNGFMILSCSDDYTIKIWENNLDSGGLLNTLKGHTDCVNSVGFSPNGSFIISGSHDKTIKLWESITGNLVRTFESLSTSVKSVCFSPKEDYVVSGDDGVKLWNYTTGTLIKTFPSKLSGNQEMITENIKTITEGKAEDFRFLCKYTISSNETPLFCQNMILDNAKLSNKQKKIFIKKNAILLKKDHELNEFVFQESSPVMKTEAYFENLSRNSIKLNNIELVETKKKKKGCHYCFII